MKPNRPLHLGPGLVDDGPDRTAQVTSPESRTEKAAGCQRRTGSPLRSVAFMEFRCHSLRAWGEFPQGQRPLAPPGWPRRRIFRDRLRGPEWDLIRDPRDSRAKLQASAGSDSG